MAAPSLQNQLLEVLTILEEVSKKEIAPKSSSLDMILLNGVTRNCIVLLDRYDDKYTAINRRR